MTLDSYIGELSDRGGSNRFSSLYYRTTYLYVEILTIEYKIPNQLIRRDFNAEPYVQVRHRNLL